MTRYFRRVINHIKVNMDANEKPENRSPKAETPLASALDRNIYMFKEALGSSSDIIIKEFRFGCNPGTRGALLCIDGLVNMLLISSSVLKPLMLDMTFKLNVDTACKLDFTAINQDFLSFGDVEKVEYFNQLMSALLSGSTIVLIDGSKEALSIGAKQWDKRSVTEPATENVVRGPRQGFTEALRSNTAMLRRIIHNPNLRFETIKLGEQTQTDVCICYINGIAKAELVEDIKKRLSQIKTDSILDSGYVEAFIEDAPYSIFPTIGYTERPDTTAGKLLEGRAAILVDGSPIALTAPMVFIEDFQTSEDYYLRAYYATYLRFLRLCAFFLTVFAPALYVAFTTFHQELIPTPLLFTITAGLSGMPFPALVEALLMVITFDILREAGIRLPKPIGPAISIVGALVIGSATVSAGLVGPFMVIIIAITAISGFVIPKQVDSMTILRYSLLILGGILGGFGIIVGVLFFLVNIESLQSFGVPYMSPITPFSREGMKDTFVRASLKTMLFRPFFITGHNQKRRAQASGDTKSS